MGAVIANSPSGSVGRRRARFKTPGALILYLHLELHAAHVDRIVEPVGVDQHLIAVPAEEDAVQLGRAAAHEIHHHRLAVQQNDIRR